MIEKPNYKNRQSIVMKNLEETDLRALAVNPGPSMVYLTGLGFHLMERPTVVIFSLNQPPAIVLPELEALKISALDYPLQPFFYGEDPNTWTEAFRSAIQYTGIDRGNIGIEQNRMRVLELRYLETAAPRAKFIADETFISKLRLYKDKSEILSMRKAVDIAQNALNQTLKLIRLGMTERDLAAELTLQLLRMGSDPEIPFSPIVSSGPNSANPHASPSSRQLAPGDLLLFDWGASYNGYFSDLTRTFSIGAVDEKLSNIAQIVAEANRVGCESVRPGVSAHEVDLAARSVIEKSGYGAFFTHRTGHGLGMEAHEEPYIRAGNPLILEPGMTFTIEPGIYLPGIGGVRIEDNLVVTENGRESLSDMPRNLLSIPGN